MLAPRWPTAMASLRQCVRQSQAPTLRRALCSSTPTTTPRSASFLYSYRLALATTMPGVALGLSLSTSKPLLCASDRSYASATDVEPVPVESSINLQDLSFGTVSGICVGVFLKKGLKAIAFMLGGAFMFLQYMSSRSFVNVNWSKISSSYDSVVTKHAGPTVSQGGNRLAGLANTFVDFVTANVQSRATFVLGMMLGFRLG